MCPFINSLISEPQVLPYFDIFSFCFKNLNLSFMKKKDQFIYVAEIEKTLYQRQFYKKKSHRDQISFVTRHFIQTRNPFILHVDCYVSIDYIIACLELVQLFFKRYYLNVDTNYMYNHCKLHLYQVNQKVL